MLVPVFALELVTNNNPPASNSPSPGISEPGHPNLAEEMKPMGIASMKAYAGNNVNGFDHVNDQDVVKLIQIKVLHNMLTNVYPESNFSGLQPILSFSITWMHRHPPIKL